MSKLELEVVTPERQVLLETVDEVILLGVQGYLGVLPNHAPLLTALETGIIAYKQGGQFHYLAASGGFVEIARNRVNILAETSERAEEIDVERAQRSKERAEQLMGSAKGDELDELQVRVTRAVARLDVKSKIGKTPF